MSKRILTPFRKKYLNFRIAELRREVKLKCIEYKGGRCEKCGYDKCPTSLTFHHKDPTQKDFGISANGFSRSFEKCKPELDKCMLLCMNCHGEIHYEEDQIAREIRLKELKLEGRPAGSSAIKKCNLCKKDIKVFTSQIASENFCSKKCRNESVRNKDWIPDDQLLKLVETLSVKEVALKLNKNIKTVYSRLYMIKKK